MKFVYHQLNTKKTKKRDLSRIKEKLNLFFSEKSEIKKAVLKERNISKLFQQPWEQRITKFTMTPKKKSKSTQFKKAIVISSLSQVHRERPHTFCHQDKPRSLKLVLMAEVILFGRFV